MAEKKKKGATKKKTSNKKVTEKVVKKVAKKKARLNKAEIEHYKTLLLNKRREILFNVTNIEVGALKKSRQDAAGDLSSMPLHMADIGSDTFEQEFALGLVESERGLLQEIDEALERVESRTYGICQATHVMIRKARLQAQPWAKYCVEHARKLEEESS
ncbi:MAG: TraR/DksA C4-type zinc finger protein [Planctomycetes bacterium]|nr:TraR/DksA C4-type zinc finger protein [Planctomycetota bacterium]